MEAIFKGNEDIEKSAFLNWRTTKHSNILNIIVLADGFLSSAGELAKVCLLNNWDKKADKLIFPILFNANHGIELYLKSIDWTLNQLLKSKRKIEGSHNIKQILHSVRTKIPKYQDKNALKYFDSQTEDLKEYINELFDKIRATPEGDNMDFSRYPFNVKYKNHFYIEELGNIEVDLENFIIRFEKIAEALDDRAYYYYYELYPEEIG